MHGLLGGDDPAATAPASATPRDEYARRATSGGFPVALRRPTGSSRSRWFSNYVNLVLERDVLELSRVRQRDMQPRLLRQLAAQSGQMLNIAAGQAIGLEKNTAENYVKLLGPCSSSIAQSNPAAVTEYGHLLESIAVGEILKQVSWWDASVIAGHFRTSAGHEVDLILERDDGQVLAFEIKAGSRIHSEDVRGLQTVRSKLGRRLAAAIILYTGAESYAHDGITVQPLDRLWH